MSVYFRIIVVTPTDDGSTMGTSPMSENFVPEDEPTDHDDEEHEA
jgi:hypothetical protein